MVLENDGITYVRFIPPFADHRFQRWHSLSFLSASLVTAEILILIVSLPLKQGHPRRQVRQPHHRIIQSPNLKLILSPV